MTTIRALTLVALTAAAAGCPGPIDDGQACTSDADCGGEVCARDMQCFPADQVHAVTIHWTLDGGPANATTCANLASFSVGYRIGFDDTSRVLYAPVPCSAGAFPNDKWPIVYDTALVDPAWGSYSASIPAGAAVDVTIDVTVPPPLP